MIDREANRLSDSDRDTIRRRVIETKIIQRFPRETVLREAVNALRLVTSDLRDSELDEIRAMIDAATGGHTVRWFGVSGHERVPRNKQMRGRDWGWDAVCSCGWDSRTGGAIQERVREAVAEHKCDVGVAA